MGGVAGGGAGGIRELRRLIAEHPQAVEADLIRHGVRLRWVGDGTGRFTIRDLWALVSSSIGDEASALFRAMRPDDYLPPELQLAADQVNAVMLLTWTIRAAFGDKRQGKFQPLRSYPGSPFSQEQAKATLVDMGAQLGGYRRSSKAELVEWLRSRGLPTPKRY